MTLASSLSTCGYSRAQGITYVQLLNYTLTRSAPMAGKSFLLQAFHLISEPGIPEGWCYLQRLRWRRHSVCLLLWRSHFYALRLQAPSPFSSRPTFSLVPTCPTFYRSPSCSPDLPPRFNSSWVLAFLAVSACLDSLSTFLLSYLSYLHVLYTSYMLKFCQKRLIHPTEISFRVLTIELLHESFMNVFYFVVNELLKCG